VLRFSKFLEERTMCQDLSNMIFNENGTGGIND
jgi:hypothetical protein